jgi:hypothetical protein
MSTSFRARSARAAVGVVRSRQLWPFLGFGAVLIVIAWMLMLRAAAQSAVVDVASVAALQQAVANLASGTTIRIAPGRYRLTGELRIRNGVRNVALVGATGNRNDVVIVGSGMSTVGVNIALHVENAQDVRIADLSVGEAYYHPIQLHGELGAERVHISNVRLFDAGQQFLKSSVDFSAPNGVDDVIVERSLVEYTVIGPSHGYTEGIDVHHGANWIIRNNVFRNIRVPAGATHKYRPAILMWSGSRNTAVYGNRFINCERAIIFGLGPKAPFAHSHSGGAIYNNFIFRTEPQHADAGISIWDSPGTRVYHNTVIQNGTYPAAIEYRFASTTGVEIANNLTDGAILQRDGAQALVTSNYTQANASMFVNAAAGDLHLAAAASQAIDRGIAIPGMTTDWDGQPRPSGAAPDLGADERSSAPAPAPEPAPEPEPEPEPEPTPAPNQPPVASFSVSPSSGTAPLTVTFDGRASRDPEGANLTMTWTFGDGQTAAGPTVAHTYTNPSTYTVRLTVRDAGGLSASATRSISVTAGSTLELNAPTRLVVSAQNGAVRLAWTDRSTGETGYIVDRMDGRSGYHTIAQLGANATSHTDGSVPSGWHVYRVRAVHAPTGQVSASSNVALVYVN